MIIGIDLRPLIGNNTSGVEIYIKNLLHHLLSIDKKNHYILYCNAFKQQHHLYQEFHRELHQYPRVQVIHTRYPNKILNLFLAHLRWPKIDKSILKRTGKRPDIFFVPDLRPAPVSKKCKKVIVMHDLSFHHFPQFFSRKSRLWYQLINPQKELQESHHIIAVSNATKKDLTRTYNIDSRKITTIHEGIDPNFGKQISSKEKKPIRARYKLPKNFFLFLSTLEPRKNIHNLIQAFTRFKKETNNDIKLVIAGKTNPQIFATISTIKSDDILFPGFIQEEHKPALYSMAQAFLYPSLFEGFGLPLLEAMQCSTPIITSNTSSIPEVVGSAALLIDPMNQQEIIQAMKKILDPATAQKLKTKMEKQVQKFSWERCAQETSSVFQGL